MRKIAFLLIVGFVMIFSRCGQIASTEATAASGEATSESRNYGGFASQAEWGNHLVIVAGCHDCHTPKIMTDHGPVLDSSRMLSGHHAGSSTPDPNRVELAKKGVTSTIDLTEWTGPWGTSYTGNLTPDPTGTGSWTEAQFMTAIREGKFKGLKDARSLLPPMPWEMYRHMTDDELKAIFAFLRTVPPVNNVVPPPLPPAMAAK